MSTYPWTSVSSLAKSDLRRSNVLTLKPAEKLENKSVVILRNSPFETIANMTKKIQSSFGVSLDFKFSAYDQVFPEMQELLSSQKNDLVVLWLDWRFLINSEVSISTYLQELVDRIRGSYGGPILVNNWPTKQASYKDLDSLYSSDLNKFRRINYEVAAIAKETSDFFVIDLDAILTEKKDWYDERNDKEFNLPFASAAELIIAQSLGLKILPSIFMNQIRCVILDMDNTLYSGVLGEDGVEGLIFTPSHKDLWNVLSSFRKNGILLAISSKNDERDVYKFFDHYAKLLPLKPADFTVIIANWTSKADNIEEIVNILNFSEKYVVFVDDNPKEIFEVQERLPEVNTIQVDPRMPDMTVSSLVSFPGMYRLTGDQAVSHRDADIKANIERKSLEKSFQGDSSSYLSNLGMNIKVEIDKASDLDRVAELCRKTNQFNLSLKRMIKTDIENLLSEDGGYFTVSLKDKFSDSGNVGGFVYRKLNSGTLVFEEILLSCRALGRFIEYVSLYEFLKTLPNDIDKIKFEVTVGERNEPALKWYRSLGVADGGNISRAELVGNLERIIPKMDFNIEIEGT